MPSLSSRARAFALVAAMALVIPASAALLASPAQAASYAFAPFDPDPDWSAASSTTPAASRLVSPSIRRRQG